jgi:Mg/Co/Ni transporter MgtE
MKADRALSEAFMEEHPEDAARILEQVERSEAASLMEETPPPVAARVLQKMIPAAAADLLGTWSDDRIAELVEELPLNTLARLLRRQSTSESARWIEHAPSDVREALRASLEGTDYRAVTLMEPRIPALPADLSVDEARRRAATHRAPLLDYVYVIDRSSKLVGMVGPTPLLATESEVCLGDIMDRDFPRIAASAPLALVVSHPGWMRFHALPVVDAHGVLLGAIGYQTMKQVEAEWKGSSTSGAVGLALALGELCWAGGFGVLQWFGEIGRSRGPS